MKITTFLLTGLLLISAGLIAQNPLRMTDLLHKTELNLPMTKIKSVSAEDINQGLISANREFAFKLFSQILQQDSTENVFISPISINIALALLYNGADGETKQQMTKVLELQDLTLEEVNNSYQKLQNILENNSKINLSIANSIWLKEGFPVEQQFMANNQKYYQAEVSKLDFNNPTAKNTINNWVKKETNGKIKDIIKEINPYHVFFLINAIYFQGNWTEEFDKNLTKKEAFFLENRKEISIDFMSQQSQKKYFENDEFQAINLAYGKD